MNKEQFAKCPFCGKSDTLTIGKASDAFSEPDECGDPSPYMHTEAYAVVCDASKPDGPGGCGASGGYKLTEDEAIAAWNRRAALAQHQAKALEGVEPIGYIAWRDGKPAWSEDCVCEDAVFPRDIEDDCTSMAIYPATTVSALQARIAELEQDAARGQVKCHKGAVVREFENEIGNRIKITIEGPTSTSENILTPMEATELRRALIAAAPKETL